MSVQRVNVGGKNLFSDYIFSELRLQRSKHSSNSSRSSEQQDMLGLGLFSTPKVIVVHRDRKSCPKIQRITSLPLPLKRKD